MIEFPEIGEKELAQMCIIKKYRHKGNARYVFYNVNVDRKVSEVFKNWLLNNIAQIENEPLSEYNPSLDEKCNEVINLSEVDKWPIFIRNAFQLSSTKMKDLNNIKRHLIGFIIYIKTEDYIVGHIRKITPKAVLNRKGIYKVFFKNGAFSQIKEDIGLQVDDKADLIFLHNRNYSKGIVINKDNFKSIFDMHEQEKKEAIAKFKQLKLLSQSKESSKIKELIEKDKQLQKMLINPAVQEYIASFTFEMLSELKLKVGDKVSYEIDHENKEFVLPEGKEKEALRDIIKAMCGRYAQDLKGEHIIENTNVKRVLK